MLLPTDQLVVTPRASEVEIKFFANSEGKVNLKFLKNGKNESNRQITVLRVH